MFDRCACAGVEEVVDLTCEGSEAAVVDLTNNDSVLVRNTAVILLSLSSVVDVNVDQT